MKSFKNTRKKKALREIIPNRIDETDLGARSKFNFSFFVDDQEPAASFDSSSHKELCDILKKIKDYSKHPIDYWKNRRCGHGSLKVLEEYKSFPENSDFFHPSHVPQDASWARFRLNATYRLVGFLVPKEMDRRKVTFEKKCCYLDSNTFYVVFLDPNHRFYKT